MKVALYSRVSTTLQTTENQNIRLIEFTTNKGWKYEMFEETETTRKTRPVKQALLQKLRAREFDAVIIYKLDRWARSSTELILETKELLDKNVGFISISDNIDLSTAGGRLQFQILAAFAEFERSLISERTKEGLRRAKKTKTLGRPPGSKDKKPRKKTGYYLREANKKKANDPEKEFIEKMKDTYEQIILPQIKPKS